MTMEGTQDRTVLVTGGSGYLGGWCLVELLRRGYRARTTLRDLSRESEVRAMVRAEVEADDRLSILEADLTNDAGWEKAVAGCDYVLHVASPFPPSAPKDPDELIGPARDGTLRVLRAAVQAGVNRVVVTSSSAAAAYSGEPPPNPITEANWTDVEHPQARPYVRSKVLAERAAWDFMREAGAESRLTAVLPSAIMGPVLSSDLSYSVQAVQRLLDHEMPAIPRLGFSWVDVRDVADLEIRAMTAPQAAGQRFLGSGEFMWLGDVARVLRERLGPAGAKVPKRRVPSFVVRAMARFDPALRQIVGELDRQNVFSAEKARTTLGWSPRPVEETIVDCAQSLIRQRYAASE
jgi:nucleoside-diphosphate-sugar epimerase